MSLQIRRLKFIAQFRVRYLHLKTSTSPHQIQNTNTLMIEREKKDGVWDERKKAFVVFNFNAKKKKIKMLNIDKNVQKR